MIIAQGGAFGDWALYTQDGKPTYCLNLLGLQRFKVKAHKPVPPGAHKVDGFDYESGGPAKAARSASTSTATMAARESSRRLCH